MLRIILPLLLVLISTGQMWAQTDVISGNAKTYAGDTLKMYSINDHINNRETLIAKAFVDQDGNFSFNIKVKDICQAYIDLTVFKCIMYLQPNTRQTIVLPDKQKIRPEDEINPFFKKYEFYPQLIGADPNDLNVLIPQFDRNYTQALNRIITSQYSVSKAQTDSLKAKIAANFKSDNTFFNDYMRYRFAMIDKTAYKRNRKSIISEYFAGKQVLFNNPAYIDLFNEIYTGFFSKMKDDLVSYNDKYMAINDRSYYSLKRSLMAEQKIGSEMFADYLILKGIKDAYYSDTISRESLIALADSMAVSCKTKEFRNIASFMSEDFTKLMCGYPAPVFQISDRNGKNFEISNFAGKFIYLAFFNPTSYTAQNDLGLLMGIRKNVPADVLDIVVVFVSTDKKQYREFCDQLTEDLGFPIYWYNGNKDMLHNYNVRGYPTYYLINPEGTLVMNPAPAPPEGFQDKFAVTFRNWKNSQYRKEYQNKQGIR